MECSLEFKELREPEIRLNTNPVPEFIISQDAENTTRLDFEPKLPGVYSITLET